MPRRDRDDDEDDEPRPRRRRNNDEDEDDEPRPRRRRKAKPSRTGLVVGLSIGGVVLLAVVITVAVVVARKGGGGLFAGGPKPAGKKMDNGKEIDDAAVVDRAWPKIRGRWRVVDGGDAEPMQEFLSGYRYRMDFVADGRRMDVDYQIVWIRDDSGGPRAKGGEVYTVFAREEIQPGVETSVTMPVTVNSDGTLTMNQQRFRRVN